MTNRLYYKPSWGPLLEKNQKLEIESQGLSNLSESTEIGCVGKIKTFEREVDLNADKKRFWLGTLSAINHESTDSMPISLNYFEIWNFNS